jgi:hypothetical protein
MLNYMNFILDQSDLMIEFAWETYCYAKMVGFVNFRDQIC